MADIIISEFMDDAAVTKLSRKFDVVYDPKLIDRPQDLLEMVVEARGLIVRNRTQVRGALLENCRALLVVGRLGIGLDNIDLEGCRQRGIQVFPASGANTTAVKEYVIGALLTLFRRCFHVTDEVLAGSWPRERLLHKEISGHQLGLIGFGNIAREVAFAAIYLATCTRDDPPSINDMAQSVGISGGAAERTYNILRERKEDLVPQFMKNLLDLSGGLQGLPVF